ncbi:MAG TPA: glycosyltransferase [Acidobacteriaceae bacterium]|nr:glycosyltransferase [Acidobacteriaceae bacterium]
MHRNGVCAVVVTFHPRAEDLSNLAKVRSQVESLVVVDNGSSQEPLDALRDLCRGLHCDLIENGENLGIGAALNIGVRRAEQIGSRWVALFDQDSAVTDGFIAQMLVDFENQAAQRKILLMVPRYLDPKSGIERICGLDEDGGPFVTITSGSLLPIDAFSKCGYFEENLFIYTVDDEYSLRLRSKGYSIGLSTHAVLLHASGVPTWFAPFGKKLFSTTNYRPGVRYYISRNRIWMMRRYGSQYPRWVRGALRASMIDVFKLAIAERSRPAKVRMMLLGFRDGLLGRMGKTIAL